MEGKQIPSGSKRIKSSRDRRIQLQTPGLPEDIIQDILSRLPVKSLLKFKCVSKPWRYLISSPHFVQKHLKRSAGNADFTTHKILFTITTPRFNLKQCSASLLMSGRRAVPSTLDYPGKRPHADIRVVGSCHGLVCIDLNGENLYLWNPSTRKSKKIPPNGFDERSGFHSLWGFGYCESDDDYKVVGIFCVLDHGGVQDPIVMIYSSRANSWKRIDDFRCGIPSNDHGKFANGKLHFSSTRGKIVSIDLESEGYGIVEQPNYEEGCSSLSLGVLGDSLSILYEFPWKRVELWVLKESWTRVVSIPYLNDPEDPSLYTTPLLIMPNGDVLLMFGMDLVIYSTKDICLRRPRITNCASFLGVATYFESLVPL